MTDKSAVYASLGVKEYFLFDPLREYLTEGLVGGTLSGQGYIPIAPDGQDRLFSEELGVFLMPEERILRVINPLTGERIPGLDEAMEQLNQKNIQMQQALKHAEQEAQRAEQEAQRADTAEVELARLRELLKQQSPGE